MILRFQGRLFSDTGAIFWGRQERGTRLHKVEMKSCDRSVTDSRFSDEDEADSCSGPNWTVPESVRNVGRAGRALVYVALSRARASLHSRFWTNLS